MTQAKRVYVNLQALANCGDLPPVRRSIIKKKLREFELAGINLSAEKKKEFYTNSKRLAELEDDFSENMRNTDGKTNVTGNWNSITLIDKILKLRQRQAELLGFNNYAELALQSHMAESPEHVMRFLKELATKIRPATDLEFATHYLCFSDLRLHLNIDHVLHGLFGCIKKLFGISMVSASAPKWGNSLTEYFEVQDVAGKTIGSLYLDLYKHPEKRDGTWTTPLRSRSMRNGTLQLPIAIVVCNFTRPEESADEVLINWKEVLALFHEFGHALHHVLTEVDDYTASGMNGVEFDAIEMPSKFMENFLWDWETLSPMASHAETGEPMTRNLFNRALVAGRSHARLNLLHMLELALLDMKLHTGEKRPFMDVLKEVSHDLWAMEFPAWSCLSDIPNLTLGSILVGKYAAGCYTYLWGERLSADAFTIFEKSGKPVNSDLGARFRQEILAPGGSRPFMKSFSAFLRRDHDPTAFLRHYGISQK